jgi:hypothetical protein
LEGLNSFGGHGQQATLGAFPKDADLCVRELETFELELEDLTRAEAIQQHQGNESKISKGAKAAPELGDLVGGERHNHPPWLPEPETGGKDTMGSSVTKWRSHEIGVLELTRPGGQRMSGMEAI